jgi:hypothetical protein
MRAPVVRGQQSREEKYSSRILTSGCRKMAQRLNYIPVAFGIPHAILPVLTDERSG